MKVLLVDDSSTMRRIEKTQLAQLGITDTVEAANGSEALDVLGSDSAIELVLLDWNMPVMDGMEFLKKARADSRFKNLKIIMCTSESEKGKVVEAMQHGVNNYIVKPFTPELLQEKLGL